MKYFNSRPSARGDAISLLNNVLSDKFQFTPLREGRLLSWSLDSNSSNFNSRPSARGDDVLLRNATEIIRISIHAPPRGATKISRENMVYPLFQFTPLREGRLRLVLRILIAFFISIHAPPRGATFVWAFVAQAR